METRDGNEGVFGLFQKLGFVVETSFVDGLYEIRVNMDQPAQMCLTEGS